MTGLRKRVTTGLRLGVLLVISLIGVRGERPPLNSFASAITMADYRPAPIHSMAVTVHPPPATAAPTETHTATPALLPRPSSEPITPEVAPARVIIPSLGVDEAIIPIPIVDGMWDLSQLNTQVGWLTTTGERPGDGLAMVLIGHVTIRTGQSGPFGYLWRLHQGDEVIYRAGGTNYVYSILDKREVPPQEVSRLYVADGQRLLLITCADWDYLTRTYPRRLIVQAELVRQTSAK